MKGLQTLRKQSESCVFCKLNEIDELKYGPLYKKSKLVAHYYCVLFSYRLNQNGADDEGMLGFLLKDIKTELKRVKNIICNYCSRPNASVYCSHSQCKVKFHFPCGISNKSLHQFKGSFKSFCFNHRPRQKIPEACILEAEKNNPKCVVCYDDLDYKCETEVVWANCCLKTWYHRDCLQKFALSAGYLFKCAICNNRQKFKQWVQEYGIFVPKQDASWELEPNAFADLLLQHSKCDAAVCVCPYGREYSSSNGQWTVVLCRSCASQGIHPACSSTTVTPNWECNLCKIVRSKLRCSRSKKMLSGKSRRNGSVQSKNSNRPQTHQKNGSEDLNNVATSSRPRKQSSFQPGSNSGRGKKRKRTDVEDNENSDLKKAAQSFEDDPIQEDPKTCTEKANATDTMKSYTDLQKFQGSEAESDNEVVEIEEISSEASDEEEIVVDSPEMSCAGTSTNVSALTKSGMGYRRIELIDLTQPNLITEQEIKSIVDTYKNFQLSDVRYRVKKEIYIVSDDDVDPRCDDEIEIILQKNNSKKSSVSNSEKAPLIEISERSSDGDKCLTAEIGTDTPEGKDTHIVNTGSFQNNSVNLKECEEIKNVKISNETSSSPVVTPVPVSSVATSNSRHELSTHTNLLNRKQEAALLDQYLLIVLEKEANRSRLNSMRRNVMQAIENHEKYGSGGRKSCKEKEKRVDGDCHVISSDSDTDSSCNSVDVINDEVQIIDDSKNRNSASSS